jgi:hypothetical protein
MSVGELVQGCFRERSVTCKRLEGARTDHIGLQAAVYDLPETAFVTCYGQPGCTATWNSVLRRLLATKANHAAVFAAMRDACGVILALCPPAREAGDTTRLLLTFVAVAMAHKAPRDDVDFFRQVLHEIATRTGCPEVATSVNMFITLYFE